MHLLQFFAYLTMKPKSFKAIYINVLEVFNTLFQKMLWFIGAWVTVHEIFAIKISKKMLTQQKFNKILQNTSEIVSQNQIPTFWLKLQGRKRFTRKIYMYYKKKNLKQTRPSLCMSHAFVSSSYCYHHNWIGIFLSN